MVNPLVPISRSDALAAGLSRYFTGKTCKHGHLAERYVSTSGCCQCTVAAASQYRNVGRRGRQTLEDPLLYQPFPPVRLHPEDHAAVYMLMDHLNAARGRPPVLRPLPVDHTLYERYLQREHTRLPGAPYGMLAAGAAAQGLQPAFGPGRDEMHWRLLINRTPDGADLPPNMPEHLKPGTPKVNVKALKVRQVEARE